MRKILCILVFLFILPIFAHASFIFEYEIWMQAQTSLDIGSIEVLGSVYNTGAVTINLSPQWSALGGKPSNLNQTTTDLSYVNQQLSGGGMLGVGENFPFIWLTGTQEQNLSSWEGDLLSGSFGLIPYGSDWYWTSGGFIPELLVNSEFVNGPADTSLPFNRVVINLESAGQYINTPTPLIPEPSSLFLLSFGLLGVGLLRKRFKRYKKFQEHNT